MAEVAGHAELGAALALGALAQAAAGEDESGDESGQPSHYGTRARSLNERTSPLFSACTR